jgi:hypothetical protein
MFGRLNVVLATSVNGGLSYYNSETVCEAIEDSNGLAATEFCCFEPKRLRTVEVYIIGISLKSVLLTTLDHDQGLNNQSPHAFKHSGFGSGIRIDLINPTLGIKFGWRKITGKKKKIADLTDIKNVYNVDVCIDCPVCFSCSEYLTFCFCMYAGNNQPCHRPRCEAY